MRVPRLSVLAVVVVAASTLVDTARNAVGGIIPRWITVPIAPPGTPALPNALTVALVVDLTGASLFNVAGLRVGQEDVPGAAFYNSPQQQPYPHPSILFAPTTPDYYDTHVFTTDPYQAASVPGAYTRQGPALLGETGEVDVAWGATPNTGPAGGTGLPIAQITFLNVDLAAGLVLRPVRGEVRASDDPNTPVSLPPMPAPAAFIPEPTSAAAALIGVLLVARHRRAGGRAGSEAERRVGSHAAARRRNSGASAGSGRTIR